MNKFIAVSILLTYLLSAGVVLAHGGADQSFEVQVDEYLIDIGYLPAEFQVGESALFDFNLSHQDSKEDVDFTDIWVRIVLGEQTVFATGIHKANIGQTVTTLTFPQSGDYELHVRYQHDGKKVAEAIIPFSVKGEEKQAQDIAGAFTSGLIGFVIGIASILILLRIIKKDYK